MFFDDGGVLLRTFLSIGLEICMMVQNSNMNGNFVGVEIL